VSRLVRVDLFRADLPFRKAFRHSAASRSSSASVFVRCVADTGEVGFGETLPRDYVTGETRASVLGLLEERIMPRLLGMEFSGLGQVIEFLRRCDGKAPPAWVPADVPQCSAWCAVDIALLDTFSRVFRQRVSLGGGPSVPRSLRYSPVLSAEGGADLTSTLWKIRLGGIRQVKLKIGQEFDESCRRARRILGGGCDLRVDVNMGWPADRAMANIARLGAHGIRTVEQPVPTAELATLSRLTRESGATIIIDEGLHSRESLDALIAARACNGANIRISKCGGLVAAVARCREALAAGLLLQVGSLTGESSLLSAAHLALAAEVEGITYAESCFGLHLLREDVAAPVLQFGIMGRPPRRPPGPGFGVIIDERRLARHATHVRTVQ